MDKKIRIRIWDEQPGSYSNCLETIFWVKILKFFYAMRIKKNLDPGWATIRIRDKHPGSATLHGVTEHSVVRIVRHGTLRTNILMWHQHARERTIFLFITVLHIFFF